MAERSIDLLLLASDAKRAGDLARIAESTRRARVVAAGDAGELASLVTRGPAAAVFADLSENGHALLDAFEALGEPRPALLACGPDADGALVLRALRLGARDFLPCEVRAPELASALDKLTRASATDAVEPRRGKLLAVMGGKGGVGTTWIACQLASALRSQSHSVAIVDLALPLGDVDVHFDLRPRYSLADLAPRGDFDAAFLQTVLCEHPGGVRVLAAPPDPERAEQVGAELVGRALDLLRRDHDFVVIDVARSWSETALAVLDAADQILLVTLLDVPALHQTRRQRAVLEQLGIPASRVRVVANRVSSDAAVGDAELREFLGCDPAARIPNDYPAASASVNQGVSIARIDPGSRLTRACERLALDVHTWCGLAAPEPPAGLARRLGALLARRKNGTR